MATERAGTARAILDAAVAEVQRSGAEGTRIEVVLEQAFASKSSLYHHFGDRDALVAEAERELYRRMGQAENRALIAEAATTETWSAFADFMSREIRRGILDADQEPIRIARIRSMVTADADADQGDALTALQRTMLTAMSQIVIDAQRRGVANRDVDPFVYTAFIHGSVLSYSLVAGVVDDAEAWLEVAIPAILSPIRPAATV